MALVAGADGCRGGWVLVVASVCLEIVEVKLVPAFADLIAQTGDCLAVSVDVPIGLGESKPRGADIEARRFIGPRRSSVFPPPPRSILEVEGGYAVLNALCKGIRCGLSRQTFNILAKLREADAVMTPALQDRVFESHPEVSFRALHGNCLPRPKHRPEGLAHRRDLLVSIFGASMSALRAQPGAALDDVYDAAVLAWSASRIALGRAHRLPIEPEMDARGLRMEIVY